MSILKIYEEFSALEQVEAIALGGSRSTGVSDEKSDYDLYIYAASPVPEETRSAILKKYCSIMEIGNHYWEYEDNCRMNDGVDLDIIYRNMEEFEEGIRNVVIHCNPSNGYTTCMWHNLINSKIIFDRSGKFEEMQKRYMVPYPEKLRENIISKNMHLLSGVLPSYDMQIKKAVNRRDLVSINHRTTEFLASYFDVIFALNRLTHPGEKRLVSICLDRCELLPENFEKNLENLFSDLCSENTIGVIRSMVDALAELVRAVKQ